jgi:tRNA A-37 threonylcarbamoyl transferase component Bud32
MAVRRVLVAGRYRLHEPVGTGGMGRVWVARDEMLDRDVAVKEFVPPQWMTEAERDRLRDRTLREARSAARLNHPHVVRIYDVVHADNLPWIVMEYIESRSLHQVIVDDGPLPPKDVARIGLAVLDALTAAHAAGVLHRDVKPHNVLIGTDDRVVLTDFGLATFVDDGTVTGPGVIVGSPQYVSPERARDGASTAESDLWSLGATLYAAVEGRSPYARDSAMATLMALATEQPDRPVLAGPLAPVLEGLLRHDPAARFAPAQVEAGLRAVAAGGEPPPLVPRPRRPVESSSFGDVSHPAAGRAAVPSPRRAPDDAGRVAAAWPARGVGAAGLVRGGQVARGRAAAPPPTSPGAVASPALTQPPAAAAPAIAPEAAAPATAPEVAPAAGTPATGGSGVGDPAVERTADPASRVRDTGAGRRVIDRASSRRAVPDTDPSGPAAGPEADGDERPGDSPAPAAAGSAAAGSAPDSTRPGAAPDASTDLRHRRPAPDDADGPDDVAGPAGDPRRSRYRLAVAGVLLVALLGGGGVVVGWLTQRGDDGSGALPVPSASSTAETGGRAAGIGGFSPSTCDRPIEQSTPRTPLPGAVRVGPHNGLQALPGWSYHRDDSGFVVAVPDGWAYERVGTTVCFSDPRGVRVLSVDTGRKPTADPETACRQEAQRLAKIGALPGYAEVSIARVPYLDKAADWEYRYDDAQGDRMHAATRWFTAGGKAFALGWVTADFDWQVNRSNLTMILSSFDSPTA